MAIYPELDLPNGIEGMGEGRQNYEACHLYSDTQSFGLLHSHDFYELYINLHGANRYMLGDQTLTLRGNDLLIVSPFQIHGHLGNEPLRNYERLFLYITREVVDELSHGILPVNQLLEDATREHRFLCRVTDEQVRQAVGYIDSIRENCRHETPYTRLHDVSLLTRFLLLVLECVRSVPAGLPEREEQPPMVQQILDYINERFDQKLSLDSIANEFFISKSHLSHMFTRYTSRSLYDYILYCRINQAKRLITNGVSMTSISYQCGFNDYSNFLRSFARAVGCSPSAYRKRLQSGAGLSLAADAPRVTDA